jgi:hypothetical protein
MNKILIVPLLLLASSLPAQTPPTTLTLPISLAQGLLLPPVTGQLTVTFESVDGLTTGNLGASVQLVSLLDTVLSGRLPTLSSLLSGFPVLARIEPPPAGGLLFTGITTVEMDTGNLPLVSSSLRIFTAPLNGTFQDITTSVDRVQGSGSNSNYRAQGTSGGFSEFLVVLDLTPVSTAIGSKMDRMDQILSTNSGAMPIGVQADLAAQLATVRSDLAPGSEAAALSDLDGFISSVRSHSGTDIPNVWSSARDRVNVAGQLIAAAQTLQFSLRQRQGP